MILLLCDCKSWSSLANQLYHQSNDETDRNGTEKRKKREKEKKQENWGKLIQVYIVEDFPIFLLLTLLIHFYSIGAMDGLIGRSDRICALLSERVCMCVCTLFPTQFNKQMKEILMRKQSILHS